MAGLAENRRFLRRNRPGFGAESDTFPEILRQVMKGADVTRWTWDHAFYIDSPPPEFRLMSAQFQGGKRDYPARILRLKVKSRGVAVAPRWMAE
jgi:hypothetical protein